MLLTQQGRFSLFSFLPSSCLHWELNPVLPGSVLHTSASDHQTWFAGGCLYVADVLHVEERPVPKQDLSQAGQSTVNKRWLFLLWEVSTSLIFSHNFSALSVNVSLHQCIIRQHAKVTGWWRVWYCRIFTPDVVQFDNIKTLGVRTILSTSLVVFVVSRWEPQIWAAMEPGVISLWLSLRTSTTPPRSVLQIVVMNACREHGVSFCEIWNSVLKIIRVCATFTSSAAVCIVKHIIILNMCLCVQFDKLRWRGYHVWTVTSSANQVLQQELRRLSCNMGRKSQTNVENTPLIC